MIDFKYDFVIIVDDDKVQVKEDADFYSCHVLVHDLYFSGKRDKGIMNVIKKARAMIKMKDNFMKMYGMILNRN